MDALQTDLKTCVIVAFIEGVSNSKTSQQSQVKLSLNAIRNLQDGGIGGLLFVNS